MNVRWENTSNTTIKRIKVTVTWSKSGNNNIVRTAERTVTVKHIAPISSITVSGGGVSGTYANNGTVPVPCGTRTFTLTANPPTTSPSTSVIYQWTLPSGWSGSSSTNSITVTAPAGSTDQIVSLRYRRSDYNCFLQYFDLLMDRPQVSMPNISTTGSLGCVGSSETFTASATNATNFTWSSTGSIGVSPTSGASTTATVNGNGTGSITVTANNACQSPQSSTINRAVGTPTIYGANPGGGFVYINGNTILSVQSDYSCVGYHWRIFGGSGYINPTTGACSYTYGGTTYNKTNTCYVSTNDFVRVELSTANSCGVGNGTWTFYLQNGSGFMMTSSNPATSTVSLEFKSELIAERVKSVELIRDGDLLTARMFNPGVGAQLAAFQANRTVAFDVANLTKGKYYVHVVYEDGKKFSETILLQ